MENRLMACENSCRSFEVQGPFHRFDARALCIYCGGPARPVTAQELEAWRQISDGKHIGRNLQRPQGGM